MFRRRVARCAGPTRSRPISSSIASPRFNVCRAISQQIRAIFANCADLIEPLSLDQAYLDVTEDRRGIGSATAIAVKIRARIVADTGRTASVGVSYDRFIASWPRIRASPTACELSNPRSLPSAPQRLSASDAGVTAVRAPFEPPV